MWIFDGSLRTLGKSSENGPQKRLQNTYPNAIAVTILRTHVGRQVLALV